MSSFVGHSLVAIVVGGQKRAGLSPAGATIWTLYLITLALTPDIDYLFRYLNINTAIRLTHSLLFTLLLPSLTLAILAKLPLTPQQRTVMRYQVILAGLSHLLLDLLVGVTPLPLFWPLSETTFRPPFGLLPSAGQIQLTNPYFYRNLFIELGVLFPLAWLLLKLPYSHKRAIQTMCLLVSLSFMFWASQLTR